MRTILLLAATAAVAIAQTDTNTITITASRNVTAVPDNVIYSVVVQTASSATLNDAVAKLAGTGITAANLSYVTGGADLVQWSFELITPFAKMQETSATLARLAQPASSRNTMPPFTFSVSGQQTSQDAQMAACPLAALVSDARREADRIASGAGMHVGAIVGLSDQPVSSAVPLAVARTGIFGALAVYDPATGTPLLGSVSNFLLGSIYSPPPVSACSLVVQFRLLP